MQNPHVLPRIFQNSDGRLKRKSGEKKTFKSHKCQKDGPMRDNAPKSEILKADCSELVFKNVLPARAGSAVLQKYENEMHQSKKISKNAFCK